MTQSVAIVFRMTETSKKALPFSIVPRMPPSHKHHCPCCIPLGRMGKADTYFCTTLSAMLVRRGSAPRAYFATLLDVTSPLQCYAALAEAQRQELSEN